LQNASIIGCISYILREQGWVELWRGNIPQALKRVLTALVSWTTERIVMVVINYILAACFIKISLSEYDGSKSKTPVLDLAKNILSDVSYIALLYPFEYFHTRLASGALATHKSALHQAWLPD
jgi:hypothetical protein